MNENANMAVRVSDNSLPCGFDLAVTVPDKTILMKNLLVASGVEVET